MLVIAGHVQIDPARREQAIAAAVEMMEATRREDGCISYVLSADLTDPGSFRIFEEWASAEALDAHFAAPHMARFQATMGGLGVRELKVQRYEIASVAALGS